MLFLRWYFTIVRMIPALCFPAQAIPDYLKDTRNRVYVKWCGYHIKLCFQPVMSRRTQISFANAVYVSICCFQSTP